MGRLARLRLRLQYNPKKSQKGVSREELSVLCGKDNEPKEERESSKDKKRRDEKE